MTTEERTVRYSEILAEMIRCETVSEPGKTGGEKFRRFASLLRQLFPNVFAVCEEEIFSDSLLLRWKGRDSQKLPILLMSHHDVVEANGVWKYPPFEGTAAEGRLWGRGTLDTKGSLFAILQAAEELIGENYVPECDIWFESACTEETDGAGADAISRELEKRGLRFAFVVDEGGMILHEPISGAVGDFAMVGVGEKGAADFRFIAESAGGHASMPDRNTPLVRLGRFMAEADRAKCFPAEVSPVVCEMLRRMAPTSKGAQKFLFSHAEGLKGLLRRVMPSFSPAAKAMLQTTLAFTMADGSRGWNVLPQEAWVVGDMRSSPHQGSENSFKAVKKLADRYGLRTEILDPGMDSGVTDYRSDGFLRLENAVHSVFRDVIVTPYIMTGASDCRFFSRVSDCCLRFAPFRIDDEQLESIHGLNENVNLSALAPAVDFFRILIKGEESHE